MFKWVFIKKCKLCLVFWPIIRHSMLAEWRYLCRKVERLGNRFLLLRLCFSCFWFYQITEVFEQKCNAAQGTGKYFSPGGKGTEDFGCVTIKSTRPPIRFCSILMNPLPPPQSSLAVNLLRFLPLNSVRDDLFPFRPHWKSYDHLHNPFSLLHPGDKLWLVS